MAATAIVNPKTDSIFKPALLLMSGRALAFAATFLIPVALTRIFDPAQFGTYKQLFLIFSTVFLIAQLGMASSLYYFLPLGRSDAGRYVANSMAFLGVTGLICWGAITVASPKLAQWMSNGDLAVNLPWIGLYLFLMMLSTTFEIVLISRSRYFWASVSYAVSDVARAVAFVLPVLLFRQIQWLLYGAVAVAFLRVVMTLLYYSREFRGGFAPDRALLRRQLTYAVPFAGAIFLEILQASLPQYAVSYLFDPATFAVFAVGCLQIPLVDCAVSPTSDVMMVRMQERLADGQKPAVLEIWHDATWKLALLFFPLVAFCVVASREIITLLFTARYVASVPIFAVWSTVILFATLQVDGVMRVFAQTRFLLVLNLMRLVIIASLIRWSLSMFHLLGPVLVILLATLMFKAAALVRMKTLLDTEAKDLLPWRRMMMLLVAAAGGAVVALGVKSQMTAPVVPLLAVMGISYSITFAALVWCLDLLSSDEKLALTSWMQTRMTKTTTVFDLERG